jgi:hypothetical protein
MATVSYYTDQTTSTVYATRTANAPLFSLVWNVQTIEAPSYTGYTFSSWKCQIYNNSTNAWDYIQDINAGNFYYPALVGTIIHCRANITANTYTLAYINDTNKGTTSGGEAAGTKTFGVAYTLPTVTAKAGYTFVNWTGQSPLGSGGRYTWSTASAITWTANYTTNTYTINYDKNGGTGITNATSTSYPTKTPTVAANGFTAPSGKRFIRWSTENASNSGTTYTAGNTYTFTSNNTSSVTLYAKWGVTLSYNINGGGTAITVTAPTSVTEESGYVIAAVPTLKAVGYAFGGWATSTALATVLAVANAGGSTYTLGIADATLYAIWTENTGQKVSFSELQTVFGGSHPISMSEYQVNIGKTANTLTTLSGDFKGKGVSIDNVLSGNKAANLNTIGVTTTAPDRNADDGYVRISNIDFPFYYLGVDYGNNNNNGIWWNTNLALTFGNYSIQFTAWSANTARGILFGQKDSGYIGYYFMPTSFINGYYIKRLILYSSDNSTSYKSTWEIRLIRGPDSQYIELNANEMSSTAGQWTASDMNNFFDMFGIYAISNNYNTIPITAGQSLVLRSDLNGSNWECFKQHYVNI